jgi:hypothetical protein
MDRERPALELGALELVNSRLGLRIIGHEDKALPLPTGLIRDNLDKLDLTIRLEELSEVVFRDGHGEIADKDTHRTTLLRIVCLLVLL